MATRTYNREYRKTNTFQIAGKINYHEQLIAASKNLGSLQQSDRKVPIIPI